MPTFKRLTFFATIGLLCVGCSDTGDLMKSPADPCIAGDAAGCRQSVMTADDYDQQRTLLLDYKLKTGHDLESEVSK